MESEDITDVKRKREEDLDDENVRNQEDESDNEGFEIPKEHLRLVKRREKAMKPSAVIQKSQSKTTISDVRNVVLWVLSESQGVMPKWCLVRNKNLVSSITVIITPFIDRHTLFEHASLKDLPFFSHCIRGSMIPMSAVSAHRYPSVCPILSTFLSSPANGKNPQWVSGFSDGEEETRAESSQLVRAAISSFLMTDDSRRANDIPESLAGGLAPPGFITTYGKKEREFPVLMEAEHLPRMLINPKDLESLQGDIDYPNLIGIDCEMVDTIAGRELARVSLIDYLGRVLYDSVVLPENEVTDYITQFSGITPKMIRECKTTFKEAQRRVLSFLDEKSVLVGHSINNDLKCLKLIHERIIDTSDIFPHPNGHPSKHSLVFLLQRVLRESLDREGGHDSVDDARATLRIAMKKLARGWDYSPVGTGVSRYYPLATLIEGRSVLLAPDLEDNKYKTEGMEVNPESIADDVKLRIHVLRHFQLACENNSSRIDALKEADHSIREIVRGLDDNNIVVIFSGCGDIHSFKKFEKLADKCQDETQRIDVEKALQRAKDKAVSAFAIISAVCDIPHSLRLSSPSDQHD